MNAGKFRNMLQETKFDPGEIKFIHEGFVNGFDMGYRGPTERQSTANNLKFTVGNKLQLWNKIMKEVQLKRVAGPFESPEQIAKFFVQSPCGLIPKKGNENATRLIFHLSYPKGQNSSINACTPDDFAKVKYAGVQDAVKLCLKAGKGCWIAKSDISAAFRNLGVLPSQYRWQVMMAEHPRTGKKYYFADKCVVFGASSSCLTFSRVSAGISHIVRTKTGKDNLFYLDDHFYCDTARNYCNEQLRVFLQVCKDICMPVSEDKTEWAVQLLVFLGILICTVTQRVFIPMDKIEKVNNCLNSIIENRKITVKMLQQITGLLNFIGRSVVPGRAFTRRFYSKFSNPRLRGHHHVRVDRELRADCRMWLEFLSKPDAYSKPFMDFEVTDLVDLQWTSDASGAIGFGGCLQCPESNELFWFGESWPEWLKEEPYKGGAGIVFKELYAVALSVELFSHRLENQRVQIYCDNQAVVAIINSSSTNDRLCMILLRMIVLKSLSHNVRYFCKYIISKENKMSDAISRGKLELFESLTTENENHAKLTRQSLPSKLWPLKKDWWVNDKVFCQMQFW